MIDLDKDLKLYKSKVSFYESQNTRGEYAVTVRELKYVVDLLETLRSEIKTMGDCISREALQGEYKTACNVLLSLEQIVRSSDGWEDSAVESVHNAVQTAIKCMHDRPQGKWIRYRDNPHQPEHIKCSNCGQYWSVADHDKIFDICFNCGADMRKGGKEE